MAETHTTGNTGLKLANSPDLFDRICTMVSPMCVLNLLMEWLDDGVPRHSLAQQSMDQ